MPIDSVVLDAATFPESPSFIAPPPVVKVPEPEPPPVLDAPPKIEDLGLDPRGKRVEKRWAFTPFGRIRVAADDNIFFRSANEVSDVIFTLSPGFALGWGDYASEVRRAGQVESYFEPSSLDGGGLPSSFVFGRYIADASFFVDNSDQNSVDHDALAAGRWQGGKLTIGLRLRFQTLSGISLDVGGRVDRKLYSGALTSTYLVSEKVSLELNVYDTTSDYDTQVDSSEWMVEGWMNYQLRQKTRLSVGTRVGLTDFEGGSQQTFEQLVGRITYRASEKLSLNLDGGVEWRQFDDPGSDEVFGVFNADATYRPFDGTTFSLNAFRKNSSAASRNNENITATGGAARVSQRFLQRFRVGIEGGYQTFDYSAAGREDGDRREDQNAFVKTSLAFDVTKDLSAQGAYEYQENDSSLPDRSFSENVVSLQLTLQF